MNKQEYDFHKLYHDCLGLWESYEDEMPLYEFGFGVIRIVSKMLFDCAPSEKVARQTIEAGINEGYKWSKEEKEELE